MFVKEILKNTEKIFYVNIILFLWLTRYIICYIQLGDKPLFR